MYFLALGSLSVLASFIITITIFNVKKLNVHPSRMIGYISVFEGISTFHTLVWFCSTLDVIDYFGLAKMF